MLGQHKVTFNQEMGSQIHNFITKQVFAEEITNDVLSVQKMGIVEERLSENAIIGICAPSKKLKLKLCYTANKTKRTKIEGKIINLQSER